MPSDIEQHNRHSAESKRALGAYGERIAAERLEREGYRLVMSNFTVPIGRNANQAQIYGEIDLIAFEGEVLCFVEVKTRRSDEFAAPLSAVDRRKQRQIVRAARIYRRTFGAASVRFRYDVVTVVAGEGRVPQIEIVKNYWTESIFRKRAWSGDVW